MVGICDACYDDVTENEVLLDGSVAITELENAGEYISWKFITNYLEELKGNGAVYEQYLEWLENFSEENIIKAAAVSNCWAIPFIYCCKKGLKKRTPETVSDFV